MKALGAMGFKMIRLMSMWPALNPQAGVFVWDRLDSDIAAVTDAGMAVYLNPYWCPSHASEGQPTYEPYSAGCTLDDGTTFAKERPWCAKPAHIDPDKTELLGQAIARRYGSEVAYYGIWNEPGGIYYPPANFGGDWGKQLVDEVISPFIAGVKGGYPAAVIVGPEADSAGTLDGILRHESEAVAAGEPRWFDHLSVHPYAWDQTADLRLAEFQRVVKDRNDPRDRLWISEIGGKLDGGTPGFSDRMKRANVDVVLFHDLNEFCNAKGEPTDAYEPMRKLIAA